MARRNRHATEATGDGAYPGIVNQSYLSDYFLAYRLDAGLADLFSRWDRLERDGERTPRVSVRSIDAALVKFRPDAVATGPDTDGDTDELSQGDRNPDIPIDLATIDSDALDAQRELVERVLDAFGWQPDPTTVTLMTGDTAVEVPVLHRRDTASGLLLLAVGTVFTGEPAAVMAGKQAAAGTLLDPVRSGDRVVARTALEAAQVVFTANEAPNYLLVCSGGAITLLDRDRWGEGVYLGARLDDAAGRADHRTKGELAAIAALFSADAIDPGTDAQSALGSLLDRAANESAGVSKELRHGVRRSVELLAGAVVHDIRHRQKRRWQDIDAEDLTRQCLRYLYRIIVLLFAEARPELGILPVDDPDYQAGYSLARLRDTALVDLHDQRATTATHIQQSLEVLFTLVDQGYEPPQTLGDLRSLSFPGLKSKLFGADACPMLDRAELHDDVMQQVLANLCFTQEKKGQQRQSLSYATLGINQLGAVYEGLMAYRGFLATEPLFEVDNDGDQDTGTWVIPVSQADAYADDVFVKQPGPDGIDRRVRYDEGDFVFRLAGRDRQRSASFYTPEVLTEFTVRHALDVYEEEHPNMTAGEWLNLTICEPALGSGAFANEAVNQLAARYLLAAQREAGVTIDPDCYQLELQKAKAHFAINRTYGVDLNATAVELAEVSLWLNVMHDGLTAPRFDARLRRGNSLIGTRRATYTPTQVATAPWKGSGKTPAVAPTELSLHEHPLGSAVGIHHFLLPGEGWGRAADVPELKGTSKEAGLASAWAESVRAWRASIVKAPSKPHIERLKVLSQRVEALWARAATAVDARLRAHQRRIDVWGAEPANLPAASAGGASGDDSSVERLRLIMDAWCALWLWAPANGTDLPSFADWLDAFELLVGQPEAFTSGELFTERELRSDVLTFEDEGGKTTIDAVLQRHPWLVECQTIATSQGFFHWELDFSSVFTAGGFDLQVGNPPWVRPTWDEPASLAEHDPWWGITDLTKTADAVKRQRRTAALGESEVVDSWIADRAENEGINALLAAATREPQLLGVQTNLYMNFMTNTWRRASTTGVVGLLHPESHFVDPKAGPLRATTYRRLRRHWQFANDLKLFSEVDNNTEFGVHIYSSTRAPQFVQSVNLLSPATVDRSLDHDGTGDTPGVQYTEGGWDLRPHAHRLVRVDGGVLAEWVVLFDPPGTPPEQSRLLRPLTRADLGALSVFASQPSRLGDTERFWTRGFDEDKLKKEGTGVWRTEFPASLDDCILQGPHIINATPFAQQPRENCKNNTDWEAVDLETLPLDFVPRTNYQRKVDPAEFVRRQTVWDGKPYTTRYREAHREFVGSGSVRTLQACILPPGPVHVHKVNSNIAGEDTADTVRVTGLFLSIPYDYISKVYGVSTLGRSFADSLLVPSGHALDGLLIHRTLRLNCLTAAYDELWAELHDPSWASDAFVAGEGTVLLASTDPSWSVATPLRKDLDRWLALCEIDALVALMLGLSEEQLLQMYRAQFAVLRKYEYVTVFDGNGRQISGIHHNHGFHQAQWEADYKTVKLPRGDKRMGMWDRVQAYLGGDTSVDLGPFVPPFVPADREAAMSRAYRAFAAKVAAS